MTSKLIASQLFQMIAFQPVRYFDAHPLIALSVLAWCAWMSWTLIEEAERLALKVEYTISAPFEHFMILKKVIANQCW